MHIDTHGQGPDLVLLHGLALHGGVFAPLAERLASGFRLHLVDLPGHGASRDDATPLELDAVVDAIAARTPPAFWLGWSLGGLFALHAAATLPAVRGLVMIASSPRFVAGSDWPHAVAATSLAQLGGDLARDHAATVERFIALDTLHGDLSDAQTAALRAGLDARGEPALDQVRQGLALLERHDARRQLPALQVPSLWLAGRRDRLVPPAAMQAAAAMTPHAHFSEIAGGGHAPFLGRADQVAAAIRAFADNAPS